MTALPAYPHDLIGYGRNPPDPRWPGQRHMSVESTYEYGSRAGFWRLHRLFTKRGLPLTVFAVGMALARFLDHVMAHKEVWACRRIDIARHWQAEHPYER